MAICDETYTFHSSANRQILSVETVITNKLWFFGSNLSHKSDAMSQRPKEARTILILIGQYLNTTPHRSFNHCKRYAHIRQHFQLHYQDTPLTLQKTFYYQNWEQSKNGQKRVLPRRSNAYFDCSQKVSKIVKCHVVSRESIRTKFHKDSENLKEIGQPDIAF